MIFSSVSKNLSRFLALIASDKAVAKFMCISTLFFRSINSGCGFVIRNKVRVKPEKGKVVVNFKIFNKFVISCFLRKTKIGGGAHTTEKGAHTTATEKAVHTTVKGA